MTSRKRSVQCSITIIALALIMFFTACGKTQAETKEPILVDSSDEIVLYDGKEAKITLESIVLQYGEYDFNFLIENNDQITYKTTCYLAEGYVNDYRIFFYRNSPHVCIAPGKKGRLNSFILKNELEEITNGDFEKLECNFVVAATEDGETEDKIVTIPLEFTKNAITGDSKNESPSTDETTGNNSNETSINNQLLEQIINITNKYGLKNVSLLEITESYDGSDGHSEFFDYSISCDYVEKLNSDNLCLLCYDLMELKIDPDEYYHLDKLFSGDDYYSCDFYIDRTEINKNGIQIESNQDITFGILNGTGTAATSPMGKQETLDEITASFDYYLEFLDKISSLYDYVDKKSLNVSTIETLQTEWVETQIDYINYKETFNKKTPHEAFIDAWNYNNSLMDTAIAFADHLTDWDTNGDGYYTDDELYELLNGDAKSQFTQDSSKYADLIKDEVDSISNDSLPTPEPTPTPKPTPTPASTPTPKPTSTTTNHTPTTGESNAVNKAKSYLEVMAFSRKGLIEQLEFEGYSHDEAVYGADHCNANWKEQAAKKAKSYLEIMAYSKNGLIEQLQFEGFTYDEAVYGVEQNGY